LIKKTALGFLLVLWGCVPSDLLHSPAPLAPPAARPVSVPDVEPALRVTRTAAPPPPETAQAGVFQFAEPLPADLVKSSAPLPAEPEPRIPAAAPAPLHEEPEAVEFDFPIVNNPQVQKFIDHYSGRGKNSFTLWLKRSGRYVPMMQRIFSEEGLPRDLVYLSLVESGLNHRAYSWANAVGPWQFIESTGRMYGLQNDWWRDERRDPEKSTRAAAKYLRDLFDRFGDWHLAVAAYNAGPGKISRAIREKGDADFWAIRDGNVLQDETRDYVPKLLAAIQIAKEPLRYGFEDVEYRDPLDYDLVEIPSTTDLEVVAQLCRISYDELKELNPELKRWCTPPEADRYHLRLPAGSGELFVEKYDLLSPEDRANYKRHRVKPGDTLRALANRYGVRLEDITRLNNIDNPRALRVGMDLILPLKEGFTRLPVDELKDDYIRSRRATYVVRKGDSLWKIARKFDVSEMELRVWNRLGWSDHLRPGQNLVVSKPKPAPPKVQKIVYQVKPGDSLWKIGKQFNVGTKEIMQWNNLSGDHILRPGDKLTLILKAKNRG